MSPISRTTSVGVAALAVALGCAAGGQAAPGPPGAVVPSGYAALDPCPSAAPCPPRVTVAWGQARWTADALLRRRYVLEPLGGGDGPPPGTEVSSNVLTLPVPQPVDGRLFRFRIFGRETPIAIPDIRLERPIEYEIPVGPIFDLPRPVDVVRPRIAMQVTPIVDLTPVPGNFVLQPYDPNAPDGPAVTAEFRIDASAPLPAITQSATHIGAGESVGLSAKAIDPPGGSAPGSGVDPAGYEWDFGDGARGAGPTVEHRYGAVGSYSGSLTVRDRAGNGARQAFTVKVSPLRTDGVPAATLPRGGAKRTRVKGSARISGAAALKALGISLRPPALRAVWRESRLSGALVLSGSASSARRLGMRLRAPGLAPRELGALPVGEGRFTTRIALPAGVLPGGLTLDLRHGSRAVARIRVRVPAPPEGVARTAFASSSRLGGPLTGLPGSSRTIFARFGLAALPARGGLTVTWYEPNGQVAGHPVQKPRSRALTSYVRSSQPLPPGRWRAVLRAGNVRVAQIAVRVR
ncbi:MAG TPA: PKD domain-containing protein [Miltoncostaeaceae bacterium]|nr:PKD domain-containing protein [Miltoncostaeaceae bacterium]